MDSKALDALLARVAKLERTAEEAYREITEHLSRIASLERDIEKLQRDING